MSNSSGAVGVVRSVAVTAEDVAVAVEANRTPGPRTVIRITPPFSPLMRARLHVETEGEYGDGPRPIHVGPGTLLAADAPSYPTPAGTEDRLRADPAAEYTVERHRRRHVETMAAWRDSLADHLVDHVDLPASGDTHRVAVRVLG